MESTGKKIDQKRHNINYDFLVKLELAFSSFQTNKHKIDNLRPSKLIGNNIFSNEELNEKLEKLENILDNNITNILYEREQALKEQNGNA